MATFSRRVDADHRSLSEARAAYGDWLVAQGVAPQCRVDVDVVVTELAANVIDHTMSTSVVIDLSVDPETVVVSVAQPADEPAVPAVEQWGVDELGDRGRGLRIVVALCTDLHVERTPAHVTIRATIAR